MCIKDVNIQQKTHTRITRCMILAKIVRLPELANIEYRAQVGITVEKNVEKFLISCTTPFRIKEIGHNTSSNSTQQFSWMHAGLVCVCEVGIRSDFFPVF